MEDCTARSAHENVKERCISSFFVIFNLVCTVLEVIIFRTVRGRSSSIFGGDGLILEIIMIRFINFIFVGCL